MSRRKPLRTVTYHARVFKSTRYPHLPWAAECGCGYLVHTYGWERVMRSLSLHAYDHVKRGEPHWRYL